MKFQPPLVLETVAGLIGCDYIGLPGMLITGINEIHRVEKGDITFVDHPKYYQKALESKATIIIINKRVDCPAGKALLICEDPFSAYLSLVKRFRQFESAVLSISSSARIGENTIVQPGAFIGNNVVIGNNCLIHANVSIYDHTIIGNNVIIHSGSVIGADAFYFQKRADGYLKFESCGRVIIEDNVEIGALCSIDKGVSSDTIIGKGTKFDNHVQVGHDTHIGANCLIGAHCAIAGVTIIEDEVVLWAKVAVNKELHIGKGAVILATSAVSHSLQGGKTYFGVPAVEARKAWKQIAITRKLPQILEEIASKLP
jgi:UDP-3-O-[3-hydroxymyristoyl] glucosamine N-acyltransferase